MSGAIRLPQLNEVRLVGRLTRDPEVRYTPKGQAVARVDLAVNRRYRDTASGEWKDDTTFISCSVWREAAERVRERLKKGSPVYVEGRLKSRNWETKEGQKRTSIEVDIARIQFLEKAEGGPAAPADAEGDAPAAVPAAAGAGSDEEIPF